MPPDVELKPPVKGVAAMPDGRTVPVTFLPATVTVK